METLKLRPDQIHPKLQGYKFTHKDAEVILSVSVAHGRQRHYGHRDINSTHMVTIRKQGINILQYPVKNPVITPFKDLVTQLGDREKPVICSGCHRESWLSGIMLEVTKTSRRHWIKNLSYPFECEKCHRTLGISEVEFDRMRGKTAIGRIQCLAG